MGCRRGWLAGSWLGALLQQGAVAARNPESVPKGCFNRASDYKEKKSQNRPWCLWRSRKEVTRVQAAPGEKIPRQAVCDSGDTRTCSNCTRSLLLGWEAHILLLQPGRRENLSC